jgi:hypothetical protein
MSEPQPEFLDGEVKLVHDPISCSWCKLNIPKGESTVIVRERKDEPGKTYDAGKLRFDLIPPEWESALAAVLTKGAEKYADRNWEKGLSWSRRYASVRRHLNAFWAGEDLDKETGLPHLAQAAWGCLAILTFMTTHKEFDDRIKAEVK